MTTNTATVPDDGPPVSIGGAKVLPWPRGPQGATDPRSEWIAEAEQHVRTTVRVPADHPARVWPADVAAEVEAAGALVYRAAYDAATQAIAEARAAGDPPKVERGEQWRREIGRIKRGPKYGAPTPDRWLILADAVRLALAWLPEDTFGEGPTLALARLAEVAAERQAVIGQARAELVAAATTAETERRSAPGAWDDELARRRRAEQDAQDAQRADRKRKATLAPSPDDPMAVARHIEPEWTRDGVLILRRWRGEWWQWNSSHWVAGTDEEMRSSLYRRMEHAKYLFVDGRSGIESERRWAPTGGKVKNLAEAAAAVTLLPSSVESPGWVDGRTAEGVVIPCRNGLVNIDTRQLMPPTPLYFNTSAIAIDYAPRAPRPARWLAFLASVWPDDPAAIATLQEMFGYVLAGRRHLEKIFLLVGPKRSGKGTIATVLTALVGLAHTAAPTLASLAGEFGLAPLIGKTLAIVPDARMPRDNSAMIVEKLLMISGRDNTTVNRKHREAWTGNLGTQIVIMSNELPRLPDTAAAIVGRLITLRMVESFYGREDPTLKDALLTELPGILIWSLDGLDRLNKRGHFTEPETAREARDLLNESASPLGAFIEDRCVIEPGATVTADALWQAWLAWCQLNARDHVGTKATLGRDLFAAAPKVKRSRPRNYPGGPQVPTYEGIRLS